jgi:hypothetical protein
LGLRLRTRLRVRIQGARQFQSYPAPRKRRIGAGARVELMFIFDNGSSKGSLTSGPCYCRALSISLMNSPRTRSLASSCRRK